MNRKLRREGSMVARASARGLLPRRQERIKVKGRVGNVFVLLALLVGGSLLMVGRVTAQTFTTLHSFTARTQTTVNFTNSDGAGPNTGLILSGNTLYGTTYYGGTNGWGTVFAVNTDGTGFTTLHGFTRGIGSLEAGNPNLINSDGANPSGGLLLSGKTLYGTAYFGGTNLTGTVFVLNTDGTAYTILHSFTAPPDSANSDGANPSADLVLSGNTLYGTCYRGGPSDAGTVFAVNTDGTGFTVLHSFPAYSPSPAYTNSDGGGLVSGLILSGNTLYGAAYSGGSLGNGTVFALNTDGTGFTNLHSFTGSSDGAHPIGRLLLCGNTLYGTAQTGGSSGNGTVFAINTDGTGFTNLHSFTGSSDGAHPNGGLILSGSTLYGTAGGGGSVGLGTVFALNTDGTGFTTLHSFTGGTDGSAPWAGLILSGNTLYGTAYFGGTTNGCGTVFSIFIQPQLTLVPSGPYVILTWPTNYAGFDCTGYHLQSTTNIVSPVWTTNSAAPVVVNGQNTVTNPISSTQQFFRLSQ